MKLALLPFLVVIPLMIFGCSNLNFQNTDAHHVLCMGYCYTRNIYCWGVCFREEVIHRKPTDEVEVLDPVVPAESRTLKSPPKPSPDN
jgi:hypothetical protein